MQNNLKQALVIGASAAAAWVAANPKENTQKIKHVSLGLKDKISALRRPEGDATPVTKAGNPDPQDIEDNQMVSEGSMYGVNYYNQTKQKH